ncbi:hypothetical protein [Pantoea dispersa]|uniref:hypothetical protein n=1 Tax=Pantoea dispersa TaxID=59814 RepID=UPI00133156C2|nr:hypothetical protein [Pantoea dispersa]KAF0856741.1 hypothetical protein Y788_04830 [Pantoea dispersa 625]
MKIKYEFHDGVVTRYDEFESDGMDLTAQIIMHAADHHFPGFISAGVRGAPRPKHLEVSAKTLKCAGVESVDYWVDDVPAAKPIFVERYEKI